MSSRPETQHRTVDEYVNLLQAFSVGRLGASRFERRYLDLFQSDATFHPPDVFGPIENVFFAVDAYCGDPDLRDEYDIDEEQLRERVNEALGALVALKTPV